MSNFIAGIKQRLRRLIYDEDIADYKTPQNFSVSASGGAISDLYNRSLSDLWDKQKTTTTSEDISKPNETHFLE